MTLTEELEFRGFTNQCTYRDLTVLNNEKLTFYWGVDPSADSMTIGNLAAAMVVKCFLKHGHKAVLLIGGATGLIGDPDGKTDERTVKPLKEVRHNAEAIKKQYSDLFDGMDFTVVDNYDWCKNLNYLSFLRDIGKHVPMRQMLAREFVQDRLSETGNGISYAEFSYVLIQAYDFLHLFNNYGVTLQLCGSDQWGNSIAGVDLIRRILGKVVNVYSTPLVVNKQSGKKFGKTEDGAVWLDKTKTSPDSFYQFWINLDDDSASEYFKIYTEFSVSETKEVLDEFNRDRSNRKAQKVLAYEVTKLVHGVDEAEAARIHAEGLSSQNMDPNGLESFKVTAGSEITQILISSGLVKSKTEARRLLNSGGIYLNGSKVSKEYLQTEDFKDKKAILRRGKTLKNTVILEQEQ